MLSDSVNVDLGGEVVCVKRLTLKEIREDRELLMAEDGLATLDERREKMIAEHVTMADGSPLDVERLSLPQMRKLVVNLVGLPDTGGITDFIGLLC